MVEILLIAFYATVASCVAYQAVVSARNAQKPPLLLEGGTPLSGDYQYVRRWGSMKATGRETVGAAEVRVKLFERGRGQTGGTLRIRVHAKWVGGRGPAFQIQRHTLGQVLLADLGVKDVSLGFERFDREFTVKAKNPGALRDWFSSRLAAAFVEGPEKARVSSDGRTVRGKLEIRTFGHAGSEAEARDCLRIVELVGRVADSPSHRLGELADGVVLRHVPPRLVTVEGAPVTVDMFLAAERFWVRACGTAVAPLPVELPDLGGAKVE